MSHSVGPLDHASSACLTRHQAYPSCQIHSPLCCTYECASPSTLLRTKDSETSASAASMIAILASTNLFSHPSPKESLNHVPAEPVVCRLIECLREDFLPSRSGCLLLERPVRNTVVGFTTCRGRDIRCKILVK
ncbi:hypothetical protein V8B97DRAFT_506389 [Scleroderma yunnanense]